MIEINLLPGAGRQKRGRSGGGASRLNVGAALGGLRGSSDPYLAGAVASLLVAALVVVGLFLTQSNREETLTAASEQAVADSTRFARFARQRAQAQATRDTVLRQINVIRAIDDDRYLWPHVLDEVSSALPELTWLTSLAYTGTPQGTATPVIVGNDSAIAATRTPAPRRRRGEAAPAGPALDTAVTRESVRLQMEGQTTDLEAITRFMRQLEASPFIEAVQLGQSELSIVNGREVTTFNLQATYVRQDRGVRRVPLRAPSSTPPTAAAAADTADATPAGN